MAEPVPQDTTNRLSSNPVADVVVRASRDDDIEAMLAIYRTHTRSGLGPLGNYEIDEPQLDDMKRRRKNMKNHRLPHLVAESERKILGYTYVVPFRKRPAYRYAVKHSIYVHPDHLQRGIGRLLLAALIDACAAAGYRQMIGYVDNANLPSVRLHEAFGFRQVGYLPSISFKLGQWADMIIVQRSLGAGATTKPDIWL